MTVAKFKFHTELDPSSMLFFSSRTLCPNLTYNSLQFLLLWLLAPFSLSSYFVSKIIDKEFLKKMKALKIDPALYEIQG